MSQKEVMPEDMKLKVELMSTFQRTYCEFRARGFSQSQSAQRAGSTANEKKDLGRVGWQVETVDGAKDYIAWLKEQRAKTSIIDRTKVIEMIAEVYKVAMDKEELKEANNAAKLLGQALGLFDHKTLGVANKEEVSTSVSKNNTDAFKDGEDTELEPNQSDSKYKELQDMLKELNKAK